MENEATMVWMAHVWSLEGVCANVEAVKLASSASAVAADRLGRWHAAVKVGGGGGGGLPRLASPLFF